MAEKIICPKQGLQMTEGTIISWLKKEGETVKEGEPLFEMETDKLTITIDSTASGTLLKIYRPAGDVVPITEIIAAVGEPGEDISALDSEAAAAVNGKKDALSDAKADSRSDDSAGEVTSSAKAVYEVNNKPPEYVSSASEKERNMAHTGRIFITPRAKKLAEEKNVDISFVQGSGYSGEITERDIFSALSVKATPSARAAAKIFGVNISSVTPHSEDGRVFTADITASHGMAQDRQDEVIPFAGMRKAIRDNMMYSLSSMAQANHKIKVDMSQCALIRAAFKKAEKKLSYNDIIVFALCRALKMHPQMNSVTDGDNIIRKAEVNMGIAVAVENGLIVPTVFSADKMTLSALHDGIAEKVKKAQAGKLTRDDYSGGTFTVSNLGMYDLDEFTAIINPPQVGILSVGKITDTPVAIDGQVVIRPMVTLGLTYDHRVVDGAPAAEFLRTVKQLLENPYTVIA